MAEHTNEKDQNCTVAGRCCWDGKEDRAACWNVGACGCKVIAHRASLHSPVPLAEVGQ